MLAFQQPKEEAGFRRSFSTIYHAINQAIGKWAEYNKPLCIAFIDNEKSVDSVATTAVLEALRDHDERCAR